MSRLIDTGQAWSSLCRGHFRLHQDHQKQNKIKVESKVENSYVQLITVKISSSLVE